MVLDYLILAFLSCTGSLQIAATWSGFRGLLFFPNLYLSGLIGLGLSIAGFCWFFRSGPMHLPDTSGGLAGVQQFILFVTGAVGSLTFTLISTSLLNGRVLRFEDDKSDGLDLLKDTVYFRKFVRKWQV